MTAAREAFGRRAVQVAARLTLIIILPRAAVQAVLTLVAAPARTGGGASGAPATALLGGSPAWID